MAPMTPQEATQFINQLINDYLGTLPPSARGPTAMAAQQAYATLVGERKAEEVPLTPEPE